MSINPKSVELHQCHAKRHSICCFFYHNIKDNEIKICLDNCKQRLRLENARAPLCKLAACTRQTFPSKTFTNSLNMQKQYEKMFEKRAMTRTRCQ